MEIKNRAARKWALCGLLVGLSANLYAGNMDPLSAEELASATSLGETGEVSGFSTRSLSASASTSAEIPPQTLLVERRQTRKNESSRLADVYTYHYDSNELERSIIDLNTRSVLNTSRIQGVQLPLVEAELDRAAQLLFDDDEELELISQEFLRVTGSPLVSRDQLHVKAFTFSADSLPQKVNEASSECGIRRCAQLLLYTDTDIIFEISPIVDLSANVVTQNIGF